MDKELKKVSISKNILLEKLVIRTTAKYITQPNHLNHRFLFSDNKKILT